MSAATDLRAAADRMRALAEAATSGKWEAVVLGSEGYEVSGPRVAPPADNPRPLRRLRVARCGYEEWETDKANAAYIAAMSPPVALALAALLDVAATYADDGSEPVHEAALALVAALPTNGADHG